MAAPAPTRGREMGDDEKKKTGGKCLVLDTRE